jgi:hypothetical protein
MLWIALILLALLWLALGTHDFAVALVLIGFCAWLDSRHN